MIPAPMLLRCGATAWTRSDVFPVDVGNSAGRRTSQISARWTTCRAESSHLALPRHVAFPTTCLTLPSKP